MGESLILFFEIYFPVEWEVLCIARFLTRDGWSPPLGGVFEDRSLHTARSIEYFSRRAEQSGAKRSKAGKVLLARVYSATIATL